VKRFALALAFSLLALRAHAVALVSIIIRSLATAAVSPVALSVNAVTQQ
jgi:hypothetical protein